MNNFKDNEKFFTGGAAAMIARSIISPLDKIKIIMQMNNKNYSFYNILNYDTKKLDLGIYGKVI